MEEMTRHDGIDYSWQGLHMVGPVILAFGSEAQKQRFLPPILTGEEFWCQGFSEPNAGSDLARLRTKAELDGDHFVVNGQKVWTSDGAMADWGFFLVRTNSDVKPQAGISFLLIKMDTPGVTVRPIPTINGAETELNEVFLENVRVPKDQLVGEEGQGWTYAKYVLEIERTSSAFLYFNKRELEKAKEIARQELIDGVPLLETPEFAIKVAEIEADVLALEWSVIRVLAEEKTKYETGAVASCLKLRGSSMMQRITQLQMDALGRKSLRFFHNEDLDGYSLWPKYVPGRTATYFEMRASTIYGGSQEIQKTIIAKVAFGL
jgi:alkylation response protein AidB-like acyl-CoA dehydrogenase